MKSIRLLSILIAVCVAFYAVPLHAEDNQGGDSQGSGGQEQDDQNEECQGGHIDGCETLVATVALLPTTNAPDGAGGLANLVSNNETGVVTYAFSLSVTGLNAGTYDLSIIRKSDGSTVDIGQFSIGSTNSCQGGGDDGEENDGEGDGGDCHMCGSGTGFLNADVQLPPDLDPMDIAQILISDLDGNVLLIGDLVNPSAASKIKFVAKLRVHSASGATVSTSLSNKAQAQSTAKRGKLANRFTMVASGVTPNSTFSIVVNGQAVGTARSNGKGKVLVNKLPANLLTVRSVHLVDANGNTAVRAKF